MRGKKKKEKKQHPKEDAYIERNKMYTNTCVLKLLFSKK